MQRKRSITPDSRRHSVTTVTGPGGSLRRRFSPCAPLIAAMAISAACNVSTPSGGANTSASNVAGASSTQQSAMTEETTVDVVVDDSSTYLAELAYEPDRLLVQVIPGSLLDASAIAASVGAAVTRYDDRTRLLELRLPAQELNAAAVQLAGMPEIEQIERDVRLPAADVPSDPFYTYQWYMPKIQAEAAWAITKGDPNLTIAIVDSGVDVGHADLRARLVPGYNFVDGNTDPSDCCGHGTEVAGLVGAIANNALGIAGMDWNARIMPVRVASADGEQVTANPSAVANGILWAVDHNARVINVSFSGVLSSPAIQTACQYAYRNGRLVVAAIGNSATRDPAANSLYTISVSATDATDAAASFSTFGPGVDVAAPGVNLLTTAMGGNYVQASGTSFSSPLAAGVVALMWAVRPAATPPQVVEMLLNAADPLGGDNAAEKFGHGRLNAAAAVRAARDAQLKTDTTPPTVTFNTPADGDHLSGQSRVQIDAHDDGVLREVVLQMDGVELARDSSAPYAFLLDTRAAAVGPHALTAYATDVAGNKSAAAAIHVTFDPPPDATPPEVTMLGPDAGATLSGRVDITARLADPQGLSRVSMLLDGRQLIAQGVSGSVVRVRFSWNASAAGVTPGRHGIVIVATNRAGQAASASLVVTTASP